MILFIDTAITYIWSLVLVVVFPYFFTIIKCLWKLAFKKIRRLQFKPLALVGIYSDKQRDGLNSCCEIIV